MSLNTSDEHLLIELECPVCKEYLCPPIRQCVTGHSICTTCRFKLTKCPLCQDSFSNSKNLTLEALVLKLKYPCSYREFGCTQVSNYENRRAHEDICPLKPFACGKEECSWVGLSEDVRDHWKRKHPAESPLKEINNCFCSIYVESFYVNIVEAHDELFWFKQKLKNGVLYFLVQFLGDVNYAENYSYMIEGCTPERPHCSFRYTDYCKSGKIANSELFKQNNCVQVPEWFLEKYTGNDNVLNYKLKIYQVNEPGYLG